MSEIIKKESLVNNKKMLGGIGLISLFSISVFVGLCGTSVPEKEEFYGKTWTPDFSHSKNSFSPDEIEGFKERIKNEPNKMDVRIDVDGFVEMIRPDRKQKIESWEVEETKNSIILTPMFEHHQNSGDLKFEYNGKSLCLTENRNKVNTICFKEV